MAFAFPEALTPDSRTVISGLNTARNTMMSVIAICRLGCAVKKLMIASSTSKLLVGFWFRCYLYRTVAEFLKHKRVVDRAALEECKQMACIVCGKRPTDPAHIKSRGAGGDDAKWNLIPLCRAHHSMQHQKGHLFMIERFPPYKFFLQRLGWKIVDENGNLKLRHSTFG